MKQAGQQATLELLGEKESRLAPPRRGPAWRPWWAEVAVVGAFDAVYELTSEALAGSRRVAVANGEAELRFEQDLGLAIEHSVQHAFLSWRWLIEACNDYYATVHFAMPIFVLLWLFFRHPERYRRWRDALAWTTAIAFVIFVVFPVAPPRLLPASYGFVDTMARYGGAGRLDSLLLGEAGNQYAAFPSLHLAWAAWCAAALSPVLPRRWMKIAVWMDPVITCFVVVVTANHYIVDLVAGAVVLGMGCLLAHRKRPRWNLSWEAWIGPIRQERA